MEGNNTEEIRILKERQSLTAKELIEWRSVEINEIKRGNKKTETDHSEEEKMKLKELLDELRTWISRPKIDKLTTRNTALWDSEQNVIKLIRCKGNHRSYGFSSDNLNVLLNKYETMFLLELNRLELYFGSVLVSVEQAYQLLLGEKRSKDYENYLVFSTLARSGFIVKIYKNQHYFSLEVKENDCIWEYLQFLLNSDCKMSRLVQESKTFKKIKKSMEEIKEKIKNPQKNVQDRENDSSEENINFNKNFSSGRKRKQNEINYYKIKFKRPRLAENRSTTSLIGNIMNECDFEKFRKIFKSLEIMVESTTNPSVNSENVRTLEIMFDIYTNKKKTDSPDLRVIVLGPTECFPNRAELDKVYSSQIFKLPLVIISVGVSKQIQGFLYFFT